MKNFLLLGASLLFISALQEAGVRYAWSSALVIMFLVISGILGIMFLVWERILTSRASQREPVFPCRSVHNRV